MTYDIAIAGAGFSGLALAVQLAMPGRLPAGQRLALIGDAATFGQGLAYATTDPEHLLNVPAGNMSMFPDAPGDFVAWLEAQPGAPADPSALPRTFVPRQDYARYLNERLAEAATPAPDRPALDRITQSISAIDPTADGGWMLTLANGETLTARTVVLALGHTPGPLPGMRQHAAASDHIRPDPLDVPWDRIKPADDILLVGTGLTMIDQVITLDRRGHQGQILAVSRRGLIPAPHLAPNPAPVPPAWLPAEGDLGVRFRAWQGARASGEPWRALVDGLRPVTAAQWQGFTPAERSRFLRHLAPYWNVHRHRMAPSIAARVERMRTSGQLRVVAARILSLAPAGDRVAVELRERTGAVDSATVDWVINCAGQERQTLDRGNPVLSRLARAGVVGLDPLGLGLCTDAGDQVESPTGAPVPGLYAVGPLTAGYAWEITAVPDIRRQVAALADRLAPARSGAAAG